MRSCSAAPPTTSSTTASRPHPAGDKPGQIHQLYEEHHEAFAAYLSLEDISTASDTLAEDFENAYIGTFPDEDTFIERELEVQGWTDAINEVIRGQSIPEGVLIWDHDALLEQLRAHLYDFVDLDGYLHVFSK